MGKLLFIGLIVSLWVIWLNRGYLLITPKPQLYAQFTGEIQKYTTFVQDIWLKVKPNDQQCRSIPKQIKIKLNHPMPFTGMRPLGQGCSPLNQKIGCYFTIIGNNNTLYLSYDGRQCLVGNFK